MSCGAIEATLARLEQKINQLESEKSSYVKQDEYKPFVSTTRSGLAFVNTETVAVKSLLGGLTTLATFLAGKIVDIGQGLGDLIGRTEPLFNLYNRMSAVEARQQQFDSLVASFLRTIEGLKNDNVRQDGDIGSLRLSVNSNSKLIEQNRLFTTRVDNELQQTKRDLFTLSAGVEAFKGDTASKFKRVDFRLEQVNGRVNGVNERLKATQDLLNKVGALQEFLVIPAIDIAQRNIGNLDRDLELVDRKVEYSIYRLENLEREDNVTKAKLSNQDKRIAVLEAKPAQDLGRLIRLEDRVNYNHERRIADLEIRPLSGNLGDLQAQITRLKGATATIEATKLNKVEITNYVPSPKFSDFQRETSSKINQIAIPVLTPQQLQDITRVTTNRFPLIEARIRTLENGDRENKKVNLEGLSLLGAIRRDVQGIPDATKNKVCELDRPGECLGKRFDNLGNKIDALAQGAQLALLTKIDFKLGNQLPGGVSGFMKNSTNLLSKLYNFVLNDRVISLLTLFATLHNAMMLSNALGQTLFGVVNLGAQALGLNSQTVNADGTTTESPFDVNAIIQQYSNAFMQATFGEDLTKQINHDFAKYNRIYQAASSLMNATQQLIFSVTAALEIVGSQVAKIGNALKIFGVLGEKAYNFMNPQPNFQNPLILRIQRTQETVSTVEQVASSVVSIQQSGQQLTTASTELDKSLAQKDAAGTTATQGRVAPEAKQTKEDSDSSKLVSSSPNINKVDLVNPSELE